MSESSLAIITTVANAVVALGAAFFTVYISRRQARQAVKSVKAFIRDYWFDSLYIVGIAYWSYRLIVEEIQKSYHAGVSAAFLVLYVVMYTLVLSRRREPVVLNGSQDTDTAIKVIVVQGKMLNAVVGELDKRGLLSDEIKMKIADARNELAQIITHVA
jgi:hypothetical protein